MPIVLAVAYLCPLDILASLIVFYWVAVLKDWALLANGIFRRHGRPADRGAGGPVHGELRGSDFSGPVVDLAGERAFAPGVVAGAQRGRGTTVRSSTTALPWSVCAVGGLCDQTGVVGLGMSLPLALGAFLLMTLVYFVTVKLMAATGFAYLFPHFTHMKGETFIVDLIGSIHLSPRSLIAFKLFTSQAFFGTIRMPAWPAMAHQLRIFSLRQQPGWTTAAVVVAFPVGFLVAGGGGP